MAFTFNLDQYLDEERHPNSLTKQEREAAIRAGLITPPDPRHQVNEHDFTNKQRVRRRLEMQGREAT